MLTLHMKRCLYVEGLVLGGCQMGILSQFVDLNSVLGL